MFEIGVNLNFDVQYIGNTRSDLHAVFVRLLDLFHMY